MVGYALVGVGVMSVLVQAGAIGPIVKKLGERRALYFGLGMGLAAFLLYGVAWRPWLVFVAIALGGFWGVWSAAAQTLLSKAVAPTEQGRLQGALASLRAGCMVLTPGLFNGAFALGVSIDSRWAGAPMLVSAALLVLAIPFALTATQHTPDAQPASA
jgi:DHA1 family tetracycline resistance protein-like MFS transporter